MPKVYLTSYDREEADNNRFKENAAKAIKCALVQNDLTTQDLANMLGVTRKCVYDRLTSGNWSLMDLHKMDIKLKTRFLNEEFKA